MKYTQLTKLTERKIDIYEILRALVIILFFGPILVMFVSVHMAIIVTLTGGTMYWFSFFKERFYEKRLCYYISLRRE